MRRQPRRFFKADSHRHQGQNRNAKTRTPRGVSVVRNGTPGPTASSQPEPHPRHQERAPTARLNPPRSPSSETSPDGSRAQVLGLQLLVEARRHKDLENAVPLHSSSGKRRARWVDLARKSIRLHSEHDNGAEELVRQCRSFDFSSFDAKECMWHSEKGHSPPASSPKDCMPQSLHLSSPRAPGG